MLRMGDQCRTVIIFDNNVQNKPLANQTPSLSSCDMLSWQQVFISIWRPFEESLFIRLSVKCDSSCTVTYRLKKSLHLNFFLAAYTDVNRFLSKTADKAYLIRSSHARGSLVQPHEGVYCILLDCVETLSKCTGTPI